MLLSLHERPYFLFPNVLERWSFQKNRTGIWSFLYHQERWYSFSPKMYHSLGGKWKMIFLKKKTKKKNMEIWYIHQIFRKDGFSIKIALEFDLSYIMRKDGISFSRRYDFFFRTKNERWFLKRYMEIWCFLYVGRGGISFSYEYEITLLPKKQRWSFPEKIHITFLTLLKKIIFILEKMILAFSVILWRPF